MHFLLEAASFKFKQKFEFLYHVIDWARLLSVVVGVPSFLNDKPLDFHDTTFSVLPIFFEV